MVFRRTATGLTVAVLALSISFAVAQQNGTTTQNPNGTPSTKSPNGRPPALDRKFMAKAAQGGMAEVELGHLAVQNGGSDAVKQFGQRMVDDHSKANDQLMQLASQKNVTLPKSISQKDKMTKSHLSKLTGAAFDNQYISDMVKDHEQDIADFQHEADQGQDPDVKEFASSTLPTLKMHLTFAESVRDGKGMPADSSGSAPSGNH